MFLVGLHLFFLPAAWLVNKGGGWAGACSQPGPPLAHGAVLVSGLRAGGARDGLHGGRQGAEEAGDEGESQAAPGAEH